MGNAMSGVLAILFMDALEKRTLTCFTNITLYKRYVDDTFILTRSRSDAEEIYNTLNQAHPAIKFEIEHPTEDNSISLLDFTIKVHKEGRITYDFYQKKAKASLLPHYKSALPSDSKRNILVNEIKRRDERCSSPSRAAKHRQEFDETCKLNGYPPHFLQCTRESRRTRRAINRTQNDELLYLEFPYIDDKTDRRIKRIFRDVNLPIRLFRRSYTLRNALAKKQERHLCTIRGCTLKNDLCLQQCCVYQLTCEKCGEFYIGSTIRHFHTRLREHLTSENSSVYKHRQQCQSDFDSKIIARESDRVKLRFKEALLIHKLNATINSREEREELKSLIF
jgi:hypothetical protein